MALQGIDIQNSGVVKNVQVSPEGGAVVSPGLTDVTAGVGTVTTPGLGGNIATINAAQLPKGQYRVTIMYFFSGTTAEVLTNNLKVFSQGVVVVSGLPTPASLNVVTSVELPRVSCDGTNQLQVKAVAAATTGAIYNVYVQATRIT